MKKLLTDKAYTSVKKTSSFSIFSVINDDLNLKLGSR